MKFNSDAMDSNSPVEVILAVLKVAQDGHSNTKTGKFITSDGRETRVSHCTEIVRSTIIVSNTNNLVSSREE